ncbi:lanthionine synthetase C family protein [Streptomyces sp. NPDC006197]|uniref:lanthionine synthetase C family protein n=1 Tax=Streptomyces sp. NPDC006197 TaxID=3156685 RepID=UPI0033A6CD9A
MRTVADLLADPRTAPGVAEANRQQLAYGMPGIALLHIERAIAGLGPWQRVHDWLSTAARQPFTSGPDSHPFYGAPALAHSVACAAEHLPGPYQRALDRLDRQTEADVRRRLAAAHERMDDGGLAKIPEFDTIRGLTGYGAHLLRRDPTSALVRSVLEYLVRLTSPVTFDGESLPGWWTATGPSGRVDDRFPDGHANSGLAHGIAGPLALLSLAALRGTVVPGQYGAIRTILTWLDRWRQDTTDGTVWPYWVTRTELREDLLAPSASRRPSWCYGTAGLARAQQLAALALKDVRRQATAERALLRSLSDGAQLKAISDKGLCHGFAGLAHVAVRAAADAGPSNSRRLRAVVPALVDEICPAVGDPVAAARAIIRDGTTGPGFLDGAAGVALALQTSVTAVPPESTWDTCLLIA